MFFNKFFSVTVVLVLLVASLFFSVKISSAQTDNTSLTLESLFKACTTPDMEWISFCNGYMQAVHDRGAALKRVCSTPGITRTDLTVMFEKDAKALLRNPSNRDRDGFKAALKSMETAMPCK